MKASRFSEEQIIAVLQEREAEVRTAPPGLPATPSILCLTGYRHHIVLLPNTRLSVTANVDHLGNPGSGYFSRYRVPETGGWVVKLANVELLLSTKKVKNVKE